MNSDQLKDRIKKWLENEDYAVTERSEQVSDFHLVISNFHGKGTFADIVKLQNKDFVILGSALQNPPEFMKVLSSVAENERSDFFNHVQRDLLKFRVDHEFHPNKMLPERMIIRDVVYEEDITRTDFMEHLKRVKFASLFLLWSIGHKFSIDSAQSSTPNHLSTSYSRPPYG
ncbi:MAG TPA: DUF2299 family protein [Candidatus Nitrosotalea sp.]|nr:DUF2299 family protein [Candidatus Nitrosotalea sp.]